MVVVHIINDDGGVGSVIANLAKVQIDRGDTPIVVADCQKMCFERMPKGTSILLVRKRRLPRMLVGYSIKSLYNRINRNYPGEDVVIHAHNVSTVGLLASLKNIPLVVTVHGFSILKGEGESLSRRERMALFGTCLILKLLQSRGKSLVAVSNHVNDFWSRNANLSDIVTILNGVVASPARDERDKSWYTIAHVNDLSIWKGWDKVLFAFLRLRELHPDCKIRFISAGTPIHFNDNYIESVRHEKHLSPEDLVYLGYVRDVRKEVYAKSDVACLVSKSEGLGLSIVEALSVGVPCIGSCTGGIPEAIEDGTNGFLVDYSNCEDSLLKALEELMDPRVWQQSSQAARATFFEKFTAEKMETQYRELYKLQLSKQKKLKGMMAS